MNGTAAILKTEVDEVEKNTVFHELFALFLKWRILLRKDQYPKR